MDELERRFGDACVAVVVDDDFGGDPGSVADRLGIYPGNLQRCGIIPPGRLTANMFVRGN